MGEIVEVPGDCFRCGKQIEAEFYCYGCKEYVCDDCITNTGVSGPGHDSELHFALSDCCNENIYEGVECEGCGESCSPMY